MDCFSPLHWAHVQAQSAHMGNSPLSPLHPWPGQQPDVTEACQSPDQSLRRKNLPGWTVIMETVELRCGIVCVCVRTRARPGVDGWGLEGCSSQRKKGSLTLCDPMAVAYQAPPSMGFSWQEYWSGVPSPSPNTGVGCYFLLQY